MSSFGGTVKLTGESEYRKALKEITSNLKVLNSEMKVATSQYDKNDKSVENLASQNDVLNKKIDEQEKKVGILKDALVKSKEETGENSEQTKRWQTELNNAQAELNKLNREVEENEAAMKDAEDATKDAAKGVKDIGDKADESKDDLKKLGDTLKKGVAVGLAAVTAAATAAVAAIVSSVEATKEYRTAMGKLETAFTTSGHSAEAATKTYKELQSVLGETDQAVEAAAFVAELADNEEELSTWTNIATGIYAKFGASLPIEGLTEAANETAKVGQVTGSLADALNWAEITSEDWEKALGKNKKALTAFKKATKDGEKVEDAFTAALEACVDEQERQEIIMNTLNEVYSEAADAYRETNKEVIASNKATEKMNAAWAKVGKKAAPIVSTFQEGIADLCESFIEMVDDVDIEKFQNTIKNSFSKLSNDVIPKLLKALEWCVDHFDELKAVTVGFLAAFAVNKISTFAISIGSTLVGAVKSLIPALTGATAAQEGMNVAAAANPYILLASAIIAVVSAVGSLASSYYEGLAEQARINAEELYGLSEAEKEVADRAIAAGEAFRSQKAALDETVNQSVSHFDYIQTLKDELISLADASGKVDEKDRARADFILGQLNKALGTEYELTGKQIKNYQQLKSEIEKVIETKKAELLLESYSEEYANALKNKSQAENDYYANIKANIDAKKEWDRIQDELKKARQEEDEAFFLWEYNAAKKKILQLEEEAKVIKETYNKTNKATNDSKETLQGYYDTIGRYETAHMQTLEGNHTEASKILTDLGHYYNEYAADVGYASDEIQNKWELDAIAAGIAADHIKTNWEKGTKGYTKKMVDEAEASYTDMLDAYANAHKDAKGVGKDMGDGLGEGLSSKTSFLVKKARGIVSSIISAFRKEGDCHSPSRKMIAFGKDMDDGIEIGLENGTKSLLNMAKGQTKQLIDVYNSAAKDGEDALAFVGNVANEINSVMDGLLTNIHTALPTEFNANVATNINASKINAQNTQNMLVTAFRDALKEVKIVLNDREMGTFVTDTVAKVVYAQ